MVHPDVVEVDYSLGKSNLSTAEHRPHAPLGRCCLEALSAAVEMLVELVGDWGCSDK